MFTINVVPVLQKRAVQLLMLSTLAAVAGCSRVPQEGFKPLSTADRAIAVEIRDGADFVTVSLNRTEALEVVHAAANAEPLGRGAAWATCREIRFYRETNVLGSLPFDSDAFSISGMLCKDRTGVFKGVQQRLDRESGVTNVLQIR